MNFNKPLVEPHSLTASMKSRGKTENRATPVSEEIGFDILVLWNLVEMNQSHKGQPASNSLKVQTDSDLLPRTRLLKIQAGLLFVSHPINVSHSSNSNVLNLYIISS